MPSGGKYLLLTYGCQMNDYDSELIRGVLEKMDFEETREPSSADIILLNTCCVRENADLKVYGRLGEFKRLKKERPQIVLGVLGCLAQLEGSCLVKRFPQVDMVLGTHNLSDLAFAISAVLEGNRPLVRVEDSGDEFDLTPRRATEFSALVPISIGCDCFCAFCVVPIVRGPLRSRPMEELVGEVESLARCGYVEVTLLGQNVNMYGRDMPSGPDFVDLLCRLNDIEPLRRIRFTSPHPRDFSDSDIAAIARLAKVCEHIHLPLQAGDDEVLRRMRRGYDCKSYLFLVEKIREFIPGVSITTDLIVGFPGETVFQFENTLRMVERVQFDNAFMFAYSPRRGTEAAQMRDEVPLEERMRRLRELIALQNEITLRRNRSLTGGVVEVLIEGPAKKESGMLTGRTRSGKVVNFRGDKKTAGEFRMVKLSRAFTWGFVGEIMERE